MALFLGIDFGTSTNMVTYWNEDKKRAEPIYLGEYGEAGYFANVIYYESENNIIVGDVALAKGNSDFYNAVFSIKRRLESSDFRQYIPNLNRSLGTEEIVADIFSWIKKNVEMKFGGQSIDGVVISVPFAFQNTERERIKIAARRAGLPVLGLIEEPVAAALSFGLFDDTKKLKAEKILVFDLGGGTFDVTIFEFKKPSSSNFKIRVLTTDGEKQLGGIDIDDVLVKKFLEQLKADYPDYNLEAVSTEEQEKEIFNLRQFAIDVKENLSAEEEYDSFFESRLGTQYFLEKNFTREEFENYLREFLNEIENVLDSTLSGADLEPQDIDRIIMVGGTSNIPAINEKVRQYFGKAPEKIEDLETMVGKGAGLYCGLKYVEKNFDFDIAVGISKTTGIKWRGKFLKMLPRNTLYGTPSEVKILQLPQSTKVIKIPVVQGNSVTNVKIGSVIVTPEIFSKLINGRIGVKLNTDANTGTISYELYKIVLFKNQLLPDKILSKGNIGDD